MVTQILPKNMVKELVLRQDNYTEFCSEAN